MIKRDMDSVADYAMRLYATRAKKEFSHLKHCLCDAVDRVLMDASDVEMLVFDAIYVHELTPYDASRYLENKLNRESVYRIRLALVKKVAYEIDK